MTLTIDHLRAWLERREREASAAADDAFQAFDLADDLETWHASTTAYARRDLYRELLAAIEKGELPDA